MNLSAEQIIASATQLSPEDQAAVADALLQKLMDADHGPEESVAEVDAAWHDEIGRRVADIESGRVKAIPAEEAERMIRDGHRPQL